MKMIEKIQNNPMVDEIYKDGDGYWLTLKEQFHWFHGQIMHEYTLRDMLSALQSVKPVNK